MDWDRPPQRPRGPNSLQDLEDILRRLKENNPLTSFSGLPFLALALLAIAVVIVLSSYYIVEPQETAVIQRFGKFIHTAEAGLHFKLPFGIDTVRKVVTGRVLQREYGYRTVQPGIRSRLQAKGYEEESIMLSGDLNVVDLQWTVQYKIEYPVNYLFQVQDVEGTLDDISESVVRRIVGNRYSDEVLTVGRASIAESSRKEIQSILDGYKTGLRIVTVQLQNANPPDPVKAAFNEVNESLQEKERMINEAQEAYNQQIPKALGEARQTFNQAEGYALERINKSEGEVKRFSDILEQYQKAPEVTRRRMYIEAFEELSRNIGQLYVMDEKQSNILPFLDLGRGGMSRSPNHGDMKTDPIILPQGNPSTKEGK